MRNFNVKTIWENKKEILDGIKNRVFKKDAVEAIAAERNKICEGCEFIDKEGHHCLVTRTRPCCGSCGCSLSLKQRSLSSDCPEGYWDQVLTEEQDIEHEILNPDEDA